ncbi:unnamed protein product [Rhizoctonia solani]|uniref:Fork-head domain-containing protein n=1 Tax=Rhizoctonia solani TaxID=456999 RepID=A0A8H3E6W9_9AGAM|nr:unnamed protein product [Rhizoctonia solani]
MGMFGPGRYYRKPFGDAHLLSDLKDGPNPNAKPHYPYSTLIRFAIKNSPNLRLLLEDIYSVLVSRFPYFKTTPPGWKVWQHGVEWCATNCSTELDSKQSVASSLASPLTKESIVNMDDSVKNNRGYCLWDTLTL